MLVKKDQRFFVVDLAVQCRNQVIRIAVGEKQIEIAIIIIIKELQTPSTHQSGRIANTGRTGLVIECFIVIVLINREHLTIDIRHE